MKMKFLISSISLLVTVIVYGQQGSCADSSFRLKYTFGNNGATFYNAPDTTGKNIFTGYFQGGVGGIALMKTNWGDSVFWARQVNVNGYIRSTLVSPDGSIIGCGSYGGVPTKAELMLSKIDTNGKLLWIKRITIMQPITNGGGGFKNINVENNAIYLLVGYNALTNIVAKLDLNGNIIWSRRFWTNSANQPVLGVPIYNGSSLSCLGHSPYDPVTGIVSTIVTTLSDADGSILGSWNYKPLSDPVVKGVLPIALKFNANNTYSISGYAQTSIAPNQVATSGMMFNTLLNSDLDPIHNYYYKNNVLAPSFDVDYNDKKEHAFLGYDASISNKYFITFDKNDEVLRSRKFTIIPSTYFNYLNFDNKDNVHFLFHYNIGAKEVLEYARISNLAPNGTYGCFGKDTSIVTRLPFTLTKEPFTWDNTASNLLVSIDVPYSEDTAFVTKELVCKITSLCDKVTIKGPPNACVGQPVRYTITRNNGCYKNADWNVDTTVANILSVEGDSAVNLSFKKIFNGHIYASFTDCVVKDSFLVNITPSPVLTFVKRDSLLCPGKSITLNAITGFSNYQWQDGTSGGNYIINKPGLYKVTATNYCGNISSDSILVTNSDTSLNIILSQTICLYDTAFIALPDDVTNILWKPNTNGLLNNKTLSLYPQQNTLYTISAERMPNCTLTKQTEVVIKVCPQTFFMPNSFTPNNDGRNDFFKPSVSLPLTSYHMQVFNRYGQIVFESTNQYSGWDGTYKGNRQPMGGYIYQCSYRFSAGIQKIINGYFILLR